MALHFPRAMPALPQAVPLVVMLSRGCYICYILPSAPSAFGAVNCFAVASARTAWGHQSLAACLAGKALSGAYSSCYYDLTNYSSATWISFESAHVQGPLKLRKSWSLGHKIWPATSDLESCCGLQSTFHSASGEVQEILEPECVAPCCLAATHEPPHCRLKVFLLFPGPPVAITPSERFPCENPCTIASKLLGSGLLPFLPFVLPRTWDLWISRFI